MNSDRLERVMSAVEEFAAGEMDVTVHPDGAAEVKGYRNDPSLPYCDCKDHEHNCEYCKHTVAAVLKALWDDDCSIEIRGPDVESDGGSTMLRPQYEQIPRTLRAMDSWVVWQRKRDQVIPLNLRDGGIVVDDRDAASFEEAKTIAEEDAGINADGVAFLVSDRDPFTTERYPNAWRSHNETAVHALETLVDSPVHYVEVAPNRRDVTAVQFGLDGGDDLRVDQRAVPITGKQVDYEDLSHPERKEVV